jgi:hypothetical protein
MVEVQLTEEFLAWLMEEHCLGREDAEEFAQQFVSYLCQSDGFRADELLRQRLEKLEEIVRLDTCCAYCGEAYPKGTPRFGSDALTVHIKECPEHPMRVAEERIAALERAIRAALPFLREMAVYLDAELGCWAQTVRDMLKEEVKDAEGD